MIVADTSALVSLASGSVLDLFLEEFAVIISRTVMEELEELSQTDDRTGESATLVLLAADSLQIREINGEKPVTDRIDEGEASSAVLLREQEADFLITDDLRALPEIEKLVGQDKVAISPIVLKALVKRDVLTKNQALKKLEQMGKERDWLHLPIYKKAKKLLEN